MSGPDYFLCTDCQIIRRYRIRDPRHFVTDHKLVCDILCSNNLKENMQYLKDRTRFSHCTPKYNPLLQMDSLYHNVKIAAIPPVSKARKGLRTLLISDASWRLVDQRNTLRKLPGSFNQTEYRNLIWSWKTSINKDQKRACCWCIS